MPSISREMLDAYLDDALSDPDTARLETALRESDHLRKQLRNVIQERDRGEHSLGAIWRRERLSRPTREQLGSYLLRVLDDGHRDYIEFHLNAMGCSFCLANFADLEARHKEPAPQAQKRRRRYFESSADYLQICKEKK
jgi:hypothetical protein